ncbi:hypothetical protein [Pseudoxanthomonas dokdonensis]|uniref:hypothetical protein n=1 Tax=Pseudoxanthomonas dokdonensis TaxID=344882 RepID=UPI0012EEA18C|nr:hypothetical protein [Pseudoxanthomonas dokdonensis]
MTDVTDLVHARPIKQPQQSNESRLRQTPTAMQQTWGFHVCLMGESSNGARQLAVHALSSRQPTAFFSAAGMNTYA